MSYRWNRRQDKQIRNIKKNIHDMKFAEEVKYFDSAVAPFQTDTDGEGVELNDIPLGDDTGERVGYQVRCTSINIKGYFVLDSDRINGCLMRITLVWVPSGTPGGLPTLYGATSTGTDAIFDTVPTTASGIPTVFAPKSQEYFDKYDVIYDKVINIKPDVYYNTQAPAAVAVQKFVKFKIRKHFNRIVKYDADTGTITSIAQNTLVLYFSVDNATNSPTIGMTARLFYKDN